MGNVEKVFRSHKMKQLFVFAVFFICMVLPIFAEEDATTKTLTNNMNILLSIVGSPWVKGIALIALIVLALGMFISHEQGVIKKFIPWIAACIIFMSAGSITNKFITGLNGSTFSIADDTSTTP